MTGTCRAVNADGLWERGTPGIPRSITEHLDVQNTMLVDELEGVHSDVPVHLYH